MDFDHAKILHERGDLDAAIIIYDKLLNKNFNNIEVMFFYANALLQQGKTGLAANVFKSIIEVQPKQQAALQNLGNCFRAENKTKEAEEIYRMGLKLGDTAQLWANIGGIYINNGTPEKALESYLKAKSIDPQDKEIDFNISLAQLEMGNYRDGWENYRRGFEAGNRKTRTYNGVPEWDGTHGKNVIVWGEQGIGDEIRFASVIPDLMKVSGKVIFDCHPRLEKTFSRSFGIECHGSRKTQYLEWLKDSGANASVCISTLCNYFRNDVKDFPGTPFLKADQSEVDAYRKGQTKPRIGLSWTGGTQRTRRDTRTIGFDSLLPVLKQDFDFYSFQYNPEAAREVCELEEKHGIHIKHYPNLVECKDYDKTVNFAASMDMVITVPTTLVHLSGSLGIPTLVMVPEKSSWMYYSNEGKLPWYGSSRVFKQSHNGDWEDVVSELSKEINAHFKRVQGSKFKAA